MCSSLDRVCLLLLKQILCKNGARVVCRCCASPVPEGISPSLSGSPFSSASPGSDHDVASVSKSSSPPVLPFSEDDLKTVARGFERHLHLYPAYIHGRSKKGSIVIYRRLPTEATKETYLPSRDLLIDGFLLQKAVEQVRFQGTREKLANLPLCHLSARV